MAAAFEVRRVVSGGTPGVSGMIPSYKYLFTETNASITQTTPIGRVVDDHDCSGPQFRIIYANDVYEEQMMRHDKCLVAVSDFDAGLLRMASDRNLQQLK